MSDAAERKRETAERQRELDRLREIERHLREMDRSVGRLPALVGYLRERDLWAIELFLLASSLWATFVLFRPPSNFANLPTFDIAEMFTRNEILWAWLVASAATLKIIGGLCYFKYHTTSVLLRSTGLAIGGAFWCLMGTSAIIGNPDTLFGFTGLMMGVLSWWSILRVSW